jgi:methylmalonyl-CoA/ethylmalonyl-CoA epimerase
MTKPTKINHIALGVTDMQAALAFWQDALGLELERIEEVPAEKARVAFLPLGESEIELVEPTAEDTGLARYLEKRGPGIHHVCVQVEDIQAMMSHLAAKGVRLINPEPVRKTDGKQYAFIHPESTHGVLVELYQLSGGED